MKKLLVAVAMPMLASTAYARVEHQINEKYYDCALVRQFPDNEKTSEFDVTIRIDSVGEHRQITGMEVIFVIDNKRVERSKQYRNWKFSLTDYTESFVAMWSGVWKRDGSVTMKGIFSVPEDESPMFYSEEQWKDGKLNWAAVWRCYHGV